MKKSEEKKSYVRIGTIGHVDHGKTVLTAAIKNYMSDYKDKCIVKNSEDITINEQIVNSVEHVNKVELDRLKLIEEGKKYIKPETIQVWEEFAHEYACFCSGLFLGKLVEILKRLDSGMTIEEAGEYIERSMLTKKLINYICIALIRFSDYGFKFYESFYQIDVPENQIIMVNEYETAMCRMLTKKENK